MCGLGLCSLPPLVLDGCCCIHGLLLETRGNATMRGSEKKWEIKQILYEKY